MDSTCPPQFQYFYQKILKLNLLPIVSWGSQGGIFGGCFTDVLLSWFWGRFKGHVLVKCLGKCPYKHTGPMLHPPLYEQRHLLHTQTAPPPRTIPRALFRALQQHQQSVFTLFSTFFPKLKLYICLVPIPRKLNNSWMAVELSHLLSVDQMRHKYEETVKDI